MDVLGHGLSFRSHADDGDRGTVIATERKKEKEEKQERCQNQSMISLFSEFK